MKLLFSFLLIFLGCTLSAQSGYRSYAAARAALPELHEFFALPNDAHYPEQLEPNIQWLEKAFGRRGFAVRRLPTAGIELLLAEWKAKSTKAPTVLFYVQVDGQPVDPTKWEQAGPFVPTLKEQGEDGQWRAIDWKRLEGEIDPDWRIFVRSASDAKGPIVSFLAAWDAMREMGRTPPYSIKVIMDTEEELGSPNLPEAVEKYRTDLAADHLVILDGPPHISNRPTLVYGARGIATARITVYGPTVPLHSGHYGNYAPNPALRLAQLLASMKNEAGRVTIPGWYDGITIDETAAKLLAAVPDDETTIRQEIGIAVPDSVGNSYQESLQYPSLNIRGLSSGWVGAAARTIVPAVAVANLDIRLVRESSGERLMDLLKNHLRQQGYHLISGEEPTEEERATYPKLASFGYEISYAAFRTPMTSPTGQWLRTALTKTLGEAPVEIRTHGGSIPIAPFVETLGVPAVIVPLVNPDNNQHSPNENVRLGNYFRGAEMCLGILLQGVNE